jgi:single-stranded-DNA-specific exonuclease
MDLAVARLRQAYGRQEKVAIYGDFDLDGSPGVALLMRGLSSLGLQNLLWYQPRRLEEGYGFHAAAVEKLHAQGATLIITVDVGITGFAACEVAHKLGIDVILTDHHQPEGELPQAVAVINPNQVSCTSGLGYLCGTGVAFFLLRALRRELREFPEALAWNLNEVVDLFALATVTDLVPLVGDNRALVRLGLKKMAQTQNLGLKALLQDMKLYGKDIFANDVAMKIGPRLNALTRMDTPLRVVDLLLAKSLEEAKAMVAEIQKAYVQRRSVQKTAEAEVAQQLETWQTKNEKIPFVFLTAEQIHPGVIGLIANQVAEHTGKPCFVATRNNKGLYQGSARAPRGIESDVLTPLRFSQSHLLRAGGHSAATGFEFSPEQRENFLAALVSWYGNSSVTPAKKNISFDCHLQLKDLSPGFIRWLRALGPFGVACPAPTFCFTGLQVKDWRLMQEKHLKLQLTDKSLFPGSKYLEVVGLAFSADPRWREAMRTGIYLDIVGEVDVNEFAGRQELQILIQDLQVTEALQNPRSANRPSSEGLNL